MSDTVTGALIGAGAALAGVFLTIAGTLITEALHAKREREGRLHGVRQDLYSRYLAHVRQAAAWVEEGKRTGITHPRSWTAPLTSTTGWESRSDFDQR